MGKGRQRYLAMMVLSDKRYIRENYSLDGGSLEYVKAERLAIARFKGMLEERRGMVGALYEAAAFTDERKVVFSSDMDVKDPNTNSHEEVHVRASMRQLRDNWQETLPLEESIAYAYGDYVALNAGKDFTMPRDIRERQFLSKHSMRIIQCIEYDDHKPGVFGSSLRMLYKSAEPENKNLAWALDVAANYLLYRECLQTLLEHGAEGLEILLDALKVASVHGLEAGWKRIMARLERRVRDEIISEAQLRGRPLIIRSPYSSDCISEDIELEE